MFQVRTVVVCRPIVWQCSIRPVHDRPRRARRRHPSNDRRSVLDPPLRDRSESQPPGCVPVISTMLQSSAIAKNAPSVTPIRPAERSALSRSCHPRSTNHPAPLPSVFPKMSATFATRFGRKIWHDSIDKEKTEPTSTVRSSEEVLLRDWSTDAKPNPSGTNRRTFWGKSTGELGVY